MSPITLDRRLREAGANLAGDNFATYELFDESTGRTETQWLNLNTMDVYTSEEFENLVARYQVRKLVREGIRKNRNPAEKRVVEQDQASKQTCL